ncbi:MAG TPA: TonB-dependent receptor [Bacteroides reticulotermitis]|nr:TonB-dependent receptor [Bacteroides reticulotermitis]
MKSYKQTCRLMAVAVKLIVLVSLCAAPFTLSAQVTATMIRGVVKAASDKTPLPGIHVLYMNKDGRVVGNAVTDIDGNYSLRTETRAGDKIVFSFVGMKKKTVPMRDGITTINALMEDDTLIDEVVVTAKRQSNNGFMNINERDLTTAVSRISMDEIADGLAGASVDDVLQGQIAGLDITASSGNPGSGMSMRIRGTTSINGSSQPMIVVDGFPYETEISADFDFATADEEEYSQLLNISPADIKEIAVLKDAAATALYGSKAANGVLLITTKRGSVVTKPRVAYSFKANITERPEGVPTLSGSEYTTMIQEGLMNSGRYYDPTSQPEFAYDVNQPYYFYNYGQNTDWFRAVTRTGFSHEHNVSISGGGEKAQYRASVGYYNWSGTTIGTSLDRITARLNVDYNISRQLKFQASMAYVRTDNDKNYISYLSSSADVSGMAFNRMPNMSIYEYNEIGQLTGGYFSPLTSPQGYWNSNSNSSSQIYNPVAMAENGSYSILSNRITSNLSLIWTPISWLRYQLDVSFDVMNDKKKAFLPQTATGRLWNEIAVNKSDDVDSEAFTMYTMNKVLFMPNLGKNHNFQGMLALTTNDKRSYSYKATSGNSASPFLQDPSIPSRVAGNSYLGINSGNSQNRTVGLLANVQYSLLDRYILGASARYDGSSRFGKDERWGMFPSISFRWRVSGEPFMKWSEKWLDELSLRTSYGVNGNQPKYDYGYVSLYNLYDYSYLGESGSYPSSLELNELRWERSTQWNFGVNFAAFSNRLNIDFEVYNKHTTDLFFYNLTIPSSTGFSNVNMNVGTMDNKGFELSVKTVPFRTKDWRVMFNFNIARNNNYIREISDYYPMESGVSTSNGSYIRRFEINQSLGSIYGYRYKGVYLNSDQTIARDKNGNKIYSYDSYGNPVPVRMRFSYPSIGYEFQAGDAMYEDINNDGNIDYKDIVYLGNASPILTGGFGPGVSWKQISLQTFFNFRYGNKIINSTKMNLENMRGYNNQSKAVLKRWRHSYEDEASAPSGLLPRALIGVGYNYLGSDRFVEDGSFLRFKSLTLKYTFKKEQLKKTFLSDCSVYLTLNNLYIWTNYTGQDPEVSVGSDPFKMGYDNGLVPKSFNAMLGLNVSF